VERSERGRAKAASKSNRDVPHTYGEAATRFWKKKGQHCATANEIRRYLVWLGDAIGEQTLLSDIDRNLVSKIIAKRRGERRWGREGSDLVSPSTVNRSVIKPLQWLFSTAREDWGIKLDNEPKWRDLLLAEPEEHVRELREDEADAIALATRPDY